MEMFRQYFGRVPDELKADILHEGFTERIHDALTNVTWSETHENVPFAYSAEERALEGDIQGFQFRLAADSRELCDIGISLHNCVASYTERVKEKVCLIVYAVKDGGYRLCIEVRGNEIWQERADHNKRPIKEEEKAIDEWRKRHKLRLLGQ
ncbi:MAG: PcfJ domain-containing protein [Treponema sp.]|nr:PcfJ domain-containing protein [Treponema sp.]